MPEMTNPMDALNSLQTAVNNGISLTQCELNPNIKLLVDAPEGTQRLSYTLIENGVVKSLAILAPEAPIDNIPCFGIGYAVLQKYKNNGLAGDIITKAIAELKNGLGKNGIKKFYIEAIVAANNLPSQKVAARVISKIKNEVIDEDSGTKSYQYLKLVEHK